MCARPKIDEETNISAVQENEKQPQSLGKPETRAMQEQGETKGHVITTQEVCALPETNSPFYRDILAVVTEKQRIVVWAVYDCFGKWQQSKSYR
jgi:hypothetical protein